MDLVTKLDVLLLLNKMFNKKNVVWGLGASALLYFKGIIKDFNDIDIMVKEDDIPTVLNALEDLSIRVSYEKDCKRALHYISATIDNVSVSILAGMKLYDDGTIKIIKFSDIYINEYVDIMDAYIPLMACKDWCKWYSLMGRVSKVDAMMEKKHLW